MGKGRPRAVEKGVLGQNLSLSLSSSSSASSSSCPGSFHVPPAPVYYPSEEEFKDPLEYIEKIRPEAERYGVCKIVPPESWSPPFALGLDDFSFPTKTQAIHQLQARPASCDPKTFELEYSRFLEDHCGKKMKKRVVFEGEELNLCKLFNAVKRFGGYYKVVKEKKWGEVSRFVRSEKVSECAKHVLCQLYSEHLLDYEEYYNQINLKVSRRLKRGLQNDNKRKSEVEFSCSKRRRKIGDAGKVKMSNKVEKEEELDQICEQCRSGLHGEVMLLCDRCNKGWHIYCLSPPLKQVPPGNWYCFECLNSDEDSFGFVPGKRYTVEAFKRVVDRAKRKWFGSASASRVQIEKKFWEIVEGLAGEVEVMYGSDLDTSIYGSGFPRVNGQRPEQIDSKVWDEYCHSPWNLNNLPKLKGSMLQAVHHNITGVMVPWLYVGMLFSSFCWHFEDHCFYSMNYLHWGEPKCWYSVPGTEANAFEKVMRSSLPDLFDAQPDLLFQLVTMLNPSVLQKNGVSVYSVLQEPGNFVITFPRSYHAGFNFGLNCAEAVNFAPADWLPHGGFGAELYQVYHKTAVLSHEELLCVVAKGDCDSKVVPHLKKELRRIYSKEKAWRERLWRSGIIKSSLMSPRKCPEYVGTEEDPTCIICKQHLYLSAVVCQCRPSAFVCLEHWEHICECKSSKLRLLYRHTLAELYGLVLTMDKYSFDERPQSSDLQRQVSSSSELNALTKKVKGSLVSVAQLAEGWLLRSCKVFQNPYSHDAYATLLKEAEQFLWAGSEMDSVRDVAKKLVVSQKWAEDIRHCLSKVRNWSCSDGNLERVHMDYINDLLNFDPLPCNEPGHLPLKEHAEEARFLIQEIVSALSSHSKISELESLNTRASNFPIYVKESEKLLQKISSAKVWMDSARKCISGNCSVAIGVDILYKLKSEILELQVQLPEAEIILDLLRQAELCQAKCSEILKTSMTLTDVEVLLQEFGNFTINVPELMILKQYHFDALSWIARYNDVLMNVCEREDQSNLVEELCSLLKDGASLKIQVDKLVPLEFELKKASCRVKAIKTRDTKMPLYFIEQVMMEADVLQIKGEKLFVDMSGALAAARTWEERANKILADEAQMPDFEDVIRSSASISVILPSLDCVKDAVVKANSWLKNAEPFLVSSSTIPGSCSLHNLDTLKELILQSKLLKISLKERGMLEIIFKSCEEWEQIACSTLQDAECLFSMSSIGDGKSNELLTKIEDLVTSIKYVKKEGLSLGFDFPEIPKLEIACSMLQWCNRVLSFCSVPPSFEDVKSLLDSVKNFSVTCVAGTLWNSLVEGVKWIRKALKVISMPSNCKLSDAEEILTESKGSNVSFPLMANRLVDAIEEHKLWQGQVDLFFSLKTEERNWSALLELKERGIVSAFSCSALEMVLSEVGKVEKWKEQCREIVGRCKGDGNPLLDTLQKIKQSLDLSLFIYGKSQISETINLCICGTDYTEDQESLICSTCKDCFHLRCLEPASGHGNVAEPYICPYCLYCERGVIFQSASGPLKFGGRQPDLGMLIECMSGADFCIVIEERDALCHVVKQALECQACLRDIMDFAVSFVDKDLSVVSKKLTTAMKATQVAGVSDHQGNCDLELALARNSWRVRVNILLEAAQKPTMQQVQWHVKEGLALNISPDDYFWKMLTELKRIGLQWANRAKKVSTDSGALGLDKVFELISEGEMLPVSMEKDLKLLQARSMLYCICRKPYDDRPKVFCVQCEEWYHINCIKLQCPPKLYVCAACKPHAEQLSTPPLMDYERSSSSKFVEPKTPSPRYTKLQKKSSHGTECSLKQKLLAFTTDHHNTFSHASGIDQLWWRNRKPFRRATRKRREMGSLCPFFPGATINMKENN